MNFALIAIQCFFILMFLAAGITKLVGGEKQEKTFEELNMPQSLRIMTGLVEVLGAIALVIGFFAGHFVAIGALVLGVTMLGATAIHIMIKDPMKKIMTPLVFAVLALLLAFANIDPLLRLFN